MEQPQKVLKNLKKLSLFFEPRKTGVSTHLAAFANYLAKRSHKVAGLARELAEGAKELANFTGLLAAWEKRLAGFAGWPA